MLSAFKNLLTMFSRHRIPILIGIGYAGFGLLTLSRQYTYDAISYLLDIEQTRLAIPLHSEAVAYNFFHSQHLLFSLFPYLWYHAWLMFGYVGTALMPTQIMNLLEGGITLGMIYALLRSITTDSLLSLLACIFLGVSYTFWSNTAMISDHMTSCLLGVVFFKVLLNTSLNGVSARRIYLLAFLNGAAMLMHQVNALFGIMFLASLFFEKIPLTRALRLLAQYTFVAALTVSVPYYIVGVMILGNSTLHDFIYWCFYYAMPGVVDVAGHYGTFNFEKFPQLFEGFGASLVGGFYWMNRIFETEWLQLFGVPVLSVLALLQFIMVIIVARRSVGKQDQRLAVQRKGMKLGAVWFCTYALLLFWWVPSYYQLWSVPLVFGTIYVAIILARGGPLRQRFVLMLSIISLVILLLTANCIAAFLPAHDISNNDYYMTTETIGVATSEKDLIVIPGNDEYDTYIPYFAKRQIVSLHALLIDRGNDIHAALHDLQDSMTADWARGGSVYVVSECRDSVKAYADLYELHHLSNDDVAPFFRKYEVEDTLDAGPLMLYKMKPPVMDSIH